MAQVPEGTGLPIFINLQEQLQGGELSLRLVTGRDGFRWSEIDRSAEIHRNIDEIFEIYFSSKSKEATEALAPTLSFIARLTATERLELVPDLAARWHWLWHDMLDPEGDLSHLSHCVPPDSEVIYQPIFEALLQPRGPLYIDAELLESLVRWSASGLFDLSHIWPRAWTVQIVKKALPTLRRTTELEDALELLLWAEQQARLRGRREPPHQSEEIRALLRGIRLMASPREQATIPPEFLALARLMGHLGEVPRRSGRWFTLNNWQSKKNKVPTLTPKQWVRILLNPFVWTMSGVSRGILEQLREQGLLNQPEIVRALAGTRASILARLVSPIPMKAERAVLDALLQAIHQPN